MAERESEEGVLGRKRPPLYANSDSFPNKLMAGRVTTPSDHDGRRGHGPSHPSNSYPFWGHPGPITGLALLGDDGLTCERRNRDSLLILDYPKHFLKQAFALECVRVA